MTLAELISALSKTNVELWHEEDKAASTDDHQVAEAKRRITALNVRRNELIEAIDNKVLTTWRPWVP